jgi:hydrogenase small subunit
MRWAAAAPLAAAFLDHFLPRLARALAEAVKEYPIVWLQASTCSGCSVSVINTIHPSIKNVILDQVLPGHQLKLMYHGTLMAATGELSMQAARETVEHHRGKYVLVVEGAIPTRDGGLYGSVGEEAGRPVSMLTWVDRLGRDAMARLPSARAPPTAGCRPRHRIRREARACRRCTARSTSARR